MLALKSFCPVTCPYCRSPAACVSSAAIYAGQSGYGMVWLCGNYPACDAYVGCHAEDLRPLGTMADRELRNARMDAHAAFDPLWKDGRMTREGAYDWLAWSLGIERDQCHIALFGLLECRQVVELCRGRMSA